MTGSLYRRGMHRGADIEGGGAADLQTDVMRFIAILALCLVVIFALVQSIPLTPVEHDQRTPGPIPESPPEPVEVIEESPAPVPVTEPEVPIEVPAEEPAEVPISVTAPPPAEQKGFSLRFESDVALRRLVARNAVGLYAIGSQRVLRMDVAAGRISFWESSTPNQFHEMEPATVPADVLKALLRSNTVDTSDVKWGVTLPADMQHDLNTHLEAGSGGALVIGTDGKLRLER